MRPENFNRKKKDDDFKAKNHKEVIGLINSYPLEVLQTLNQSEIDQLAKRFADLMKGSLYAYPLSEEFNQEYQLLERKIAKSKYKLAKSFRSSFEYYTRDIYFTHLKDVNLSQARICLIGVRSNYRVQDI